MTPAPGTEAKTEASIRALLAQVPRDLGRVNASALSADGRTQFEAARRFVQQSEDALKARNLVYAGKLADKARGDGRRSRPVALARGNIAEKRSSCENKAKH